MMMEAMEKYAGGKDGAKKGMPERLLLSNLHRRCLAAPGMYESFQLRELALELFYNTTNDVTEYLKTSGKPQMREFFECWVALIAPFMPHIAEEMWEKLGKKHYVEDALFVSIAPFPRGDAKKVDEELEASQSYVAQAREDISSILKLIRMEKPAKIELFVAADWKRKLREIAARERKFDAAMKIAMAQPEIKKHAAEVAKVLMGYMKTPGALEKHIASEFELEALESAAKMLSEEFGAPFSFGMEEKSTSPKAKNALPGKPSILIS
jgi:leucyl-tRNA synthetase